MYDVLLKSICSPAVACKLRNFIAMRHSLHLVLRRSHQWSREEMKYFLFIHCFYNIEKSLIKYQIILSIVLVVRGSGLADLDIL